MDGPKESHLKVFDCISYIHIPFQKRHKLDDNGVKCIFVSYSAETSGYQFYNPMTNKLIINHDNIFDKKSAWKWIDEEGHLNYSKNVMNYF